MITLKKLVFLVHPFAYKSHSGAAWAGGHLRREHACAEKWWRAMEAMGPDEGVAVVGWYPRGPAGVEEACSRTEAILGKRAFILRAPDYQRPDFWEFANDREALDYFNDMRDACVNQGTDWNKEEFETGYHSRKCAAVLLSMLKKRGYRLDPAKTACRGWGEEFDGCVAKYTLTLRRVLNLRRPVEIDFDMCVPGAAFVLGARLIERRAISDNLRLFLFEARRRPVGLFMTTRSALADRALAARLPKSLTKATVRSKHGWRAWPLPVQDARGPEPFGLFEPMQPVVREVDGHLQVPVSMGLGLRLAKGAFYVFAPPKMTTKQFAAAMAGARICDAAA